MMTKWTEEFIDLQKTIWRNSSADKNPAWGVHHSGSQAEAIEYVASNMRNGFGLHEKDLDIWIVWFGEDTEDGLFTVAITGNGVKSKDNALLIQEAFAHYNDALVEIQRSQKDNATLEAENARLKERLRWVPVSERLPDLDQDVLVMFSDGVIGCGQLRKRDNHNPYLDGADIRFYYHQKDRPYGLHPEYIAFWKYDSLPEVGE